MSEDQRIIDTIAETVTDAVESVLDGHDFSNTDSECSSWDDRPTPPPPAPSPPVDLSAAYQYPQRKSPLLAAAEALDRIGMDQLRDYCQDHPPTHDQCRWCNQPIITTPWYAPSGTFHMAGGGWIHEQTETSPCGPQWPYRFAEPKEPQQ